MSAVYFCGRGRRQPGRGVLQQRGVHALHVLRDGVAAEGHRAVDLRQDLRAGAAAEVPAEVRRDLEDHRDVVRLQALERLVGRAGRRRRREVARASRANCSRYARLSGD